VLFAFQNSDIRERVGSIVARSADRRWLEDRPPTACLARTRGSRSRS
jgi:hypothetical protein